MTPRSFKTLGDGVEFVERMPAALARGGQRFCCSSSSSNSRVERNQYVPLAGRVPQSWYRSRRPIHSDLPPRLHAAPPHMADAYANSRWRA